MKTKKVQSTVIRLKPELHRALRLAALQAGISMNEAVTAAIALWLKAKKA